MMQRLPYIGSTSHFFGAGDGVVVKSPMKIWEANANRRALEAKNAEAIDMERQILERLGHHPRIVPFVLHPGITLLPKLIASTDTWERMAAPPSSLAKPAMGLCRRIWRSIIQ